MLGNDGSSISNAIGLQSLLDEPVRLAAEAGRLNGELEALVMDNYKVFVENLTCSVHLKLADKKLGDISAELDGNLHELAQQCVTFKDRVNNFVGSHKRNRKTLQHHMQLVELLEVPQLVDACARNGFHDEALELANFVNGLERRHLLASEVKSHNGKLRGGSGVIQTIVDDVHRTLSGLRQQLLLQLTENIALPKEISILATLRKLDGLLIDRHLSLGRHDVEASSSANMSSAQQQQQREKLRQSLAQNSEVRLQMDFLEARTIWLHRSAERSLYLHKPDEESKRADEKSAHSLTNKASLGPYGKAMEMLEIRRTAWFAVITQFNALFQDTHHAKSSTFPVEGECSLQVASPAMVLNAWATRQVNQLLRELQVLLPSIDDGASLRSVLEQSLFFASRMGQVGCDFSALLLPLFQEVMMERFQREISKGVENFKTMLLTERISFDPDGDAQYKDQMIPLYSAQDPASNTRQPEDLSVPTATDINAAQGELAAPHLLMRFPPIAYLLNSLLTQLNYIRECPLVTTEQPALAAVFAVFQNVSAYLVQKSTEVRQSGERYLGASKLDRKKTKAAVGEPASVEKKEPMDHLYAQAIALELLPHVLLCSDTIFSAQSVRLDAKMKALNAKELRRGTAASAGGGGSGPAGATSGTSKLSCLLTSLYDARDLVDVEVLEQVQRVWEVLVQGGLLQGDVLNRQPPQQPSALHSASLAPAVPTSGPAAATPVISKAVIASTAEVETPVDAQYHEEVDSVDS